MEVLNDYFEPYSFLVLSQSVTKFSLSNLMFDIKVEKTGYQFVPKIPEAMVELYQKILGRKLKLGFRVVKLSNFVHLIHPYGPVPFHYMLYLRDSIQKYAPTWITTLNVATRIDNLTEGTFRYHDIYHKIRTGLVKMPNNWKSEVVVKWSNLSISYQTELLKQWHDQHFRSYRFEVLSDKWLAYDGMDMEDDSNLAAKFAKQSKKYHITLGGYYSNYAAEGGFGSSPYCITTNYPVIRLIETRLFERFSIADSSFIRGEKKLYTKWHAPYWKLIYLRQLIHDFGIETKDN